MKILATLLLPLLLASAARAAGDCPKNSDACSSGGKKISAFLAASAAEPAPEPAKPAAARKPAAKKGAALKPPAAEPVQAAVAVSSAAAPVPAKPAETSSPAWLLAVGGGLAGLYFYLGAGGRRGRKK